jgi:hypothetical protein
MDIEHSSAPWGKLLQGFDSISHAYAVVCPESELVAHYTQRTAKYTSRGLIISWISVIEINLVTAASLARTQSVSGASHTFALHVQTLTSLA